MRQHDAWRPRDGSQRRDTRHTHRVGQRDGGLVGLVGRRDGGTGGTAGTRADGGMAVLAGWWDAWMDWRRDGGTNGSHSDWWDLRILR